MRKKIVAGNWKMNKTLQEGMELLEEIKSESIKEGVQLMIIPSFTHLSKAAEVLAGTGIQLGAQNVHAEANGAHTGEVSASQLKSCGVEICLVGHSERRQDQAENNAELLKKTKALLNEGITVVFCCGEKLEERKSNQQEAVVANQLSVLKELDPAAFQQVVIAYEPVWAIGTGETASAQQAQDMHAFIRAYVSESFGLETANNTSILYGGSCKPSNAVELFSQVDVDGGLIGGASLKASDFSAIANSF